MVLRQKFSLDNPNILLIFKKLKVYILSYILFKSYLTYGLFALAGFQESQSFDNELVNLELVVFRLMDVIRFKGFRGSIS